MSDWREKHRSKFTTAAEALKVVKSGDRVVFHVTASEPHILVSALIDRAPELENVEIVHMYQLGEERAYCKPEYQKSFRFNGLFLSPPVRKAVNECRADYTPCLYSEIPRLWRDKILHINVFLMQVTPPDEEGYCSFGLSADWPKAAVENADIVVAQINKNVPYTFGERVHLDEIDYIVEQDSPVFMLPPPKVGEIERQIARNVAGLIEDGSTLQMGIGGIPDTVLTFLTDKKDLGVHSEMFSDGVVTLVEAGVITNKKKTLHPGKFIATFLMGTQKLYDFVHRNPDVIMKPVDYTNDPCIIGQHDKMVSINSALQVDLTGQVNAESFGSAMFSGIGGQVDFVYGASRSKGGKSIFAFSSAAAKGTASRIVSQLPAGTGVTTSRGLVHYVVTEYGVADLRGKTLRQRALALIDIAHPDFRETLRKEAKALNLI
ncbi:4-hydroxybutyrate coenzyme A transferase [uncultured delta proteobacterium]|uniref:4-hydroxybutyrate coenzyme A transferase n=1 Tax=uncultured delta proteobacterium TaxID=34034 RepID=A0A212KE18_9DELT|nr:4-hydroxybutyrate coenzyme A transferase [uncultured delta proteobacterium]